MPENIDILKRKQRQLELLLEKAEKDYNNRWFKSVLAGSPTGYKNEYLINTPNKQLSNADLKCKIKYIKANIIKIAVPQLPVAMQPLKILYAIGRHNLAIKILNRYSQVANNSERLTLLIKGLNKICNVTCRARAKAYLEKMASQYGNMSQKDRDALEEQCAYLIMLRSYSYFAGDDAASVALLTDIRKHSELLDQNIKIAIANTDFRADAKQKYELIKHKLDTSIFYKRINTFVKGMKYKFISSSALTFAAYYFGGVMPLIYKVAVGFNSGNTIAAVKTGLDVALESFPNIEQQKLFLARNDLDTADKTFLFEEDNYWNYNATAQNFESQKSVKFSCIQYVAKKLSGYAGYDYDKIEIKVANAVNVALKTVAGAWFINSILIGACLLTTSFTITLFLMIPIILSTVVVALAAGALKYVYPDPNTKPGYQIDLAVRAIYAPVALIAKVVSGLQYTRAYVTSMPIINSLYFTITRKTLNLPADNGLSVDFATVNQSMPGAMPILIEYLRLEEQAIKRAPYAEAKAKFARLAQWWDKCKKAGNAPSQFSLLLKEFANEVHVMSIQDYLRGSYKQKRNNFEVKAKEIVNKPAPKPNLLQFNSRPNFVIESKSKQCTAARQELLQLRTVKATMGL